MQQQAGLTGAHAESSPEVTLAPESAELQERGANPYEVRCYSCDTSFAPGTKQCVHCGQRLGRRSLPPLPTGAEDADEMARVSTGRNLLWVLTAMVMLLGSLMRTCQ